MPEDVILSKGAPRTYAELRRCVKQTLLVGQQKIEAALVHTYWKTGWLIDQHLLGQKKRAPRHAEVIPQLARDLDINETVLYRCIRFARAFPYLAARPLMSWAHYRALSSVEDSDLRRKLEQQTVRNGWTSRQLEDEITRTVRLADGQALSVNGSASSAEGSRLVHRLAPKRGTSGIYRVVESGGTLAVDLGFTSYFDLTPEQADGLKAGDLVKLHTKFGAQKADDARAADLYTYPAEILRVVDGDTLLIKIFLRPRHWLKERLRLRGLDCPELGTSEGRAAKRFVEDLWHEAEAMTITTTKPDKYDRYLSDIFLKMKTGEEIFLNNALLENGHATIKDSYAPIDWEKE